MDWIILFFAGLGAGVLNALAGGGSFVIFPALLLVGVPPVAANATNTFACLPGYASGAIGFYDAIMANKKRLVLYSIIALIAGYLGAEALLMVSDAQFSAIVPWLMLFAVLAFSFGGQLNAYLVSRSSGSKHAARAAPSAPHCCWPRFAFTAVFSMPGWASSFWRFWCWRAIKTLMA